jgi:hypothetical protein
MFPTWIISWVINPTEGGKRESRFNVQFGSFGCFCRGAVRVQEWVIRVLILLLLLLLLVAVFVLKNLPW